MQTKPRHPQEPPKSPSYAKNYNNGGFATVTRCTKCRNTGLYEDCPIVNPCKHCGGVVRRYGAGKWIPPVYKGYLWWRSSIKEGYWLIAETA